MTMLIFQILLMMLAAYFVGAAIACGLRKLVAPVRRAAPVDAVPRPVEPLGHIQRAHPSAAASRFEKALGAEASRAAPRPEATSSTPPPPPRAAPVDARVTTPAPAVRPPHPPVEAPHPAPPSELVVPPPPRITLTAPPVGTDSTVGAAVSSTDAAAAVVAAIAVARAASSASASASIGPGTTVSAAPVAAPADDLTRIRGIDARMAAALRDLGITRYREIAAWMRADVSRVNQALGLKNRVERDNWIEQAQMLGAGGETHHTRQIARLRAPQAVTVAAQSGATSPAVTAAVASPTTPAASGAAAAIAAAAAAVPVVRPATAPVAAPTPLPPRVEERAAFASRSVRGTPAVAPSVTSEPALPSAQPIRPQVAPTRDQLQRISGINVEIEKLLNVQGVTRYAQIAAWGTQETDRFDRLLGAPGRVRRENWIEQAQMLAKGGDTSGAKSPAGVTAPVLTPAAATVAATTPMSPTPPATAAAAAAAAAAAMAAAAARPARLQDAIQAQSAAVTPADAAVGAAVPQAPRTDFSALRSVKSEAFQSLSGASRGAANDDLKRVRGIGVLIEKRLNALGVTSYDQIANWTSDDIARYSQQLDFKGRIERENWVEQARILAAGGFTEFSRRVDRGDVDSSRSRS